MEEPFMSMWVVYSDPKDFPGKYVARRHDLYHGREAAASDEHYVADTLEEIRAAIPGDLVCFARLPDDDVKIVETWL
jgi:hypothetical protein